jgi:predicted ATPase with chaperone activity
VRSALKLDAGGLDDLLPSLQLLAKEGTGFRRRLAVLGELGLDGSIAAVAGVLPAAIGANSRSEGLICPAVCGAEAAWASPDMQIIAARSLIQLANHFRGTQVLARPQPKVRESDDSLVDLKDIKGQESAKRALEVARGRRPPVPVEAAQMLGGDGTEGSR